MDLERSGSGSGSGADARNPYPRDLIQKEPGQVDPDPDPDPDPARAQAAARGHRSLPIARENSKYPKGTPFVLNFLYLYTTNFYPMTNVGLNAFSYF